MTNEQDNTALVIAEELNEWARDYAPTELAKALSVCGGALLKSQHARIADLEAQLSAIGAGGVEALRKREQPILEVIARVLNQARCHESRLVGNLELAKRVIDAISSTAQEHATQLAGQGQEPSPPAEVVSVADLIAAGNRFYRGNWISVEGVSELIDAARAAAPPAPATLPEGWTACRIEHERGYPEDVAFGPQIMMDRLKKWLDRHFATLAAAPAQAQEDARDLEAEALRACRDLPEGWEIVIHLEKGYGGVVLIDPEDNENDLPVDGMLFDALKESIDQAVQADAARAAHGKGCGMRTDRELLELAAKAVGIDLAWSSMDGVPPRRTDTWLNWNPLTDDGDALRLAVKLNISINRPVEGDSVQHWGTYADDHTQKIQVRERDNGDPQAATRRAIVRAAAEIGATMP